MWEVAEMNDRPAKAQWYRALEEKQGKAEQQKIAAASVGVNTPE